MTPPTFRGRVPRLRFGPGLATSVFSALAWENVVTYPEARAGSERLVAPSGVEDAWTVGTDDRLSARVRQIPGADRVGAYARLETGWDGAAGWRALLVAGRDAQQLAFHPDSRNLLLHPRFEVDTNSDAVADDWTMTGVSGGNGVARASSTATDPETGAACWEHVVNAASTLSSGADFVGIRQVVGPVLPGERIGIGAEYVLTTVSGGATAAATIYPLDALGARIGAGATAGGGATGSYPRVGTYLTMPAGAVALEVLLGVARPGAGAGGYASWRLPIVTRFAGSIAFADNPYTLCTLVEPASGAPTLEPSGSRSLEIGLRAAPGATFVGF